MKLLIVFCCMLFIPLISLAEESGVIKGAVYGLDDHEHKEPLFGANAYWLGTNNGAITDEKGQFELGIVDGSHVLVISYVGFKSDTIHVHDNDELNVVLEPSATLDEVKVEKRRNTTQLKMLTAHKEEVISEHELLKAACCNLSESFETNPSVDVSFTDAVTGTKQIEMLGLAGKYSQITRENMPDIRGLSSIFGLTFIPGTWVESIQLNKGTGSVVNGFESMTGQINVELRKPETADRLYFNLFGNEGGRLEANLNIAQKVNHDWSSGLLLHVKNNSVKTDRNNDGFVDHPLSEQYIGVNRWKYIGHDGLRFQAGVRGTYIKNTGGQTDYERNEQALTDVWGMELDVKRLDGWAKLGKVYLDKPYKSLGFQLSASLHDQNSKYGLTAYDAQQQSLYANYVYQNIIGTSDHSYKTGISFQYDSYNENINLMAYDFTELVPGAYFEYAYKYLEKFDLVAGVRADYHNLYGLFFTPRMHVRFAPQDRTTLRASVGKGLRTASIFAENSGIFASNRSIQVISSDANNPYGLNPEVAWNFGFNVTQKFTLEYRDGSITLDLYRTDFQDQVIVDRESSRLVYFYNLDGQSYANSLQIQFDYELIKRLNMRMAYRYYDVKQQYNSGFKQKELSSSHRAFVNFGYQTRNYWYFDYTLNWQGPKRIPVTNVATDERSPSFYLMNAQISKTWNEKFDVYLGVENLLNFKQQNAIQLANDPYGPDFDASMIWGPVFGRMTYAGIRYRLK